MKSLLVAENTSLYHKTTPSSLVPNLPSLPLNNNNNNDFSSSTTINSFINLDQGDPVVFKDYWRKMSDKCTVEIKGCELLSYLSDLSSICWFMMPELRDAIKRLHALVGNAETEDRHIVVGNGSTQLFQAVLYALSSSSDDPINVVAAAPYYSEYQEQTDIVRSGIHKWSGDALMYDKNEAYIEVVTSPNNPDGSIRRPVVTKCGGEGKLIHDLAYYWPQYTPITHKANHDIMLFTFSKCTGHAGSRIGWAIVKDKEIAKKMTKFIQMSSIGVSKESQTRVAKIIQVLCDKYKNFKLGGSSKETELFFEHSRGLMKERWGKLREVIDQNSDFSLPKFPKAYCNFTNESSETYPAFAWLKCNKDDDCESYLEKKLKILVRGGARFGSDPMYARVSLLGKDDDFEEFLKRLSINMNEIRH